MMPPPANVQDRDCLETLSAGKAAWPSLREAVLDGAFTAERCREWSNLHGMRHRVVERALCLEWQSPCEPVGGGLRHHRHQVERPPLLRIARSPKEPCIPRRPNEVRFGMFRLSSSA